MKLKVCSGSQLETVQYITAGKAWLCTWQLLAAGARSCLPNILVDQKRGQGWENGTLELENNP